MRLVVGISGASGVVMGYELLRLLRGKPGLETHLVVTEGAARAFRAETSLTAGDAARLASFSYAPDDLGAPIASGSFPADGMIVVPCSMKTLTGIASGYAENLLLRAADVTLKEGRRLVLVPRETPLSRIHLRNMEAAAEAGAVLVPPMLSFYIGEDTLEAQVRHILGKALAFFGLRDESFVSWAGARTV